MGKPKYLSIDVTKAKILTSVEYILKYNLFHFDRSFNILSLKKIVGFKNFVIFLKNFYLNSTFELYFSIVANSAGIFLLLRSDRRLEALL
jgi:hypothetical protein